jgi:hypothetical protein
MTRGRKSEVADLVERLRGSDAAKARLTALLEALAGRRSAGQVGAALGLAGRRVQALRRRALQAALASLEPRPPGRPGGAPAAEAGRVAALEATIRELRIDLHAARVREEVALTMPHLLRDRGAKPGRRARTARSGGRGGCTPSAGARPGRAGAARPASRTPAAGSGASAPAQWPSAAGRPGSG